MTLERVVDLNDARLTLVELAGESTVESGSVRLELARPVARLTIDNPGASNAMTIRMMAQLAEAVLALGGWDGAALVLSAVPGRAFCAGGHLRDVRRVVDAPERAHRMAMAMGTVLDALLSLPITSVAAVSGLAVGGGAELITAVDHRVFDSSGRVHFVHGRLGIAPGWGGTGRLVAHVGRARALTMLHEAQVLDGPATAQLGFGLGCEGDAVDAAERILAPVLAMPVAAARALKSQVAVQRGPSALTAEADAFAEVWGGPAHTAALERLARHSR